MRAPVPETDPHFPGAFRVCGLVCAGAASLQASIPEHDTCCFTNLPTASLAPCEAHHTVHLHFNSKRAVYELCMPLATQAFLTFGFDPQTRSDAE